MNTRKKNQLNNAASRISALATSIMDLHVRIALQEVDREKRRIISGGIFLATGGIFLLFALAITQIFIFLTLKESYSLDGKLVLIIILAIDLVLGGISLRLGGYLTRGPYLPQTLEGIGKTTKAVLGK
tara:strand:- start:20605 stop:20988 length:384 start_codon:yes stop_codon:yes gene_type:complete